MANNPAHIPSLPPLPPPDSGARCVQITLPDRRWALSLLLTGRPQGGHAAVDHFLAYAQDQGLALDHLWVAMDQDQPRTAALVVLTAGGAAMAFISPVLDAADQPWAAWTLHQAIQSEPVRQRRMIQVLLDPPQRHERAAFVAAGFEPLSELQYMQRGTDVPLTSPNLPQGLRIMTWHPSLRPQFAQAIADSYRGTLDCPGLLGVRTLDEVIDGHMGTGTFVPQLWHLLLRDDQPLGVMLLNLIPRRTMAELVYLGLSPAARGQGLAQKLLTHGLGLVRDFGATSLVLAVDDANAPALRLYRRLGFVRGLRKLAMIRLLQPAKVRPVPAAPA